MTFFITYVIVGFILTIITLGFAPNSEQRSKLIEHWGAVKKDLDSNISIAAKITIGIILIAALGATVIMMPLIHVLGLFKKIVN